MVMSVALAAEQKPPIVAFGNGGCRNGSGEFRNFLSDVASHGGRHRAGRRQWNVQLKNAPSNTGQAKEKATR